MLKFTGLANDTHLSVTLYILGIDHLQDSLDEQFAERFAGFDQLGQIFNIATGERVGDHGDRGTAGPRGNSFIIPAPLGHPSHTVRRGWLTRGSPSRLANDAVITKCSWSHQADTVSRPFRVQMSGAGPVGTFLGLLRIWLRALPWLR